MKVFLQILACILLAVIVRSAIFFWTSGIYLPINGIACLLLALVFVAYQRQK